MSVPSLAYALQNVRFSLFKLIVNGHFKINTINTNISPGELFFNPQKIGKI